jgi:predicted short-subunit dehydrogenase-like oxidoreductase (DUF2520 family)
MDQVSYAERIEALITRLDEAQRYLYKQAREKAESERVYRMDLAKEILRLRAEGQPVAIVGDVARGSCANEKFQRDFAESRFRATLEAVEIIKVQISALQSLYRNMD